MGTKSTTPEPIRELLEWRTGAMTVDDASGLLALAVRRFREGDQAAVGSLLARYLEGSPMPEVDPGKVQAVAAELTTRPMMGIHCGPRLAISNPRFSRSMKGVATGDPVGDRVDGSFAELFTSMTDREIVWLLSATEPSLLYLDVRWRDAPPEPGKKTRRYIARARVVDLEDPHGLPVYSLQAGGFPVGATLTPAPPLEPGSLEETLALYLARHSRTRAGAQQPIDRLQ